MGVTCPVPASDDRWPCANPGCAAHGCVRQRTGEIMEQHGIPRGVGAPFPQTPTEVVEEPETSVPPQQVPEGGMDSVTVPTRVCALRITPLDETGQPSGPTITIELP